MTKFLIEIVRIGEMMLRANFFVKLAYLCCTIQNRRRIIVFSKHFEP